MKIFAPLFLTCSLFASFPTPAEAAKEITAGERVLVNGRIHRKCVAKVTSIPSPGFAQLSFDRAGCGDGAQAYDLSRLQRLTFVDEFKGLKNGDHVVVSGHFSSQCGGKVKEVTRSGYVAVEFDSLLCADTDGLYKAGDLTAVQFVSELTEENKKFEVGQKISTKGINHLDKCLGEIQSITDNGLAAVKFEELTCANAGKLYPLIDLSPVRLRQVKPKSHARGDGIFQRVMREIASAKKKGKRQALR